MSATEILEKVLSKTNIPYAEDLYHGKDKTKYLVYVEEDSRDGDFVDNRPRTTETFYQVHYFCPAGKTMDDSRKVTKLIKNELRSYEFSVTGVRRLAENEGRKHIIISCNIKTWNMEE